MLWMRCWPPGRITSHLSGPIFTPNTPACTFFRTVTRFCKGTSSPATLEDLPGKLSLSSL
jgi:hypothetical protein